MDEKIETECSSVNVCFGHLAQPHFAEDAQRGIQYEELINYRGHHGLCDVNEKPEQYVLQCLNNNNSTIPTNDNMYLSKS